MDEGGGREFLVLLMLMIVCELWYNQSKIGGWMKICICCSLSFTDEVTEIARKLEEMGHEVLLPDGVRLRLIEQEDFDPVATKVEVDTVHEHPAKIRKADAVLVCNYEKNGIPGYIGANSFCEIYLARYFDKPVFALNPLPEQPYIHDEIMAFGVQVIDGDLEKIG